MLLPALTDLTALIPECLAALLPDCLIMELVHVTWARPETSGA